MKTIGKYEIQGLLGRGGMSAVYKARIPVVKKVVALKLLAPHEHLVQFLGWPEIERRFILEAASLGSLRHPHVVELLDFDWANGRPFFTMEYCYQNLGIVMGEGARIETPCRLLGLDKVIHYGRQICLGLARLHRAGMVHRDIKPHNLLIDDQDHLKVCDFGLSKLRGEMQGMRPGLLVGSPYYAAPEQERDPESVDVRADIYSVGVVFHRMLTGLLPAEGIPAPSQVHPNADTSWDAFVARALAPGKDDRFPSALAMLAALDELKKRWERKKQDFCTTSSSGNGGVPEKPALRQRLRSQPCKVGPKDAAKVFECDSLGRPLHYGHHDFVSALNHALVMDRATGLVWQQSGSPDPLEWAEAEAYVASLNASGHGGLNGWRVPTVNELFSVLDPFTFGERDCIDAVFEREIRWLWSSDRRSFSAAWYVDTELGFAGWSDFSCRYHVRAVCDGMREDAWQPLGTSLQQSQASIFALFLNTSEAKP